MRDLTCESFYYYTTSCFQSFKKQTKVAKKFDTHKIKLTLALSVCCGSGTSFTFGWISLETTQRNSAWSSFPYWYWDPILINCSNFQPSLIVETKLVNSSSWHCKKMYLDENCDTDWRILSAFVGFTFAAIAFLCSCIHFRTTKKYPTIVSDDPEIIDEETAKARQNYKGNVLANIKVIINFKFYTLDIYFWQYFGSGYYEQLIGKQGPH